MTRISAISRWGRIGAGPDWTVAATTREDVDQMRLIRYITTFRQLGTLYRRDDETHELRLFDPRWIEQELRGRGFRVRRRRGYGKLRFGRGTRALSQASLGSLDRVVPD